MSNLRADPNPYAPPTATDGRDDRAAVPGARVDGDLLVLRNGTPLPSLCVKCGAPDGLELYQKAFHFRPAWAQLVGIFGMLAGVRSSVFQLPLCAACRATWAKWDHLAGRAFLLPMLVVGVPLLVVLAIPTESSAPKGIVIVGFVTVLVITKSVAQSRRRRHVVSATRIERDETWLRGVHEVVVRALVA